MGSLGFFGLALVTGIAVALQGTTNQALRAHVGTGAMLLVNTALVLLGSLVVALAGGGDAFRSVGHAAALPRSLLLGGLYGLVILVSAPIVVRNLGVTTGLALVVGGQLVAALVLDHVGAFGIEPSPVTARRLLGLLLVVLGVVLTRA